MDLQSAVAYISLLTSVAASTAAFWSAREARAANERAKEANENAARANSLALKANEISKKTLEHQKLHAPPPWTELMEVKEHNYRLQNQSGKDIEILRINSNPAEASDLIRVGDLPVLVSNGDGYELMIIDAFGGNVSSIDIEWRYLNSLNGETQTTQRIVN